MVYQEYKSSEEEWLGNIPVHWKVKKLKYLVDHVNKKVEHDEETPMPYIGLENIIPWKGELRFDLNHYVPDGVSNHFNANSVLFGKLRPYLAKVCITEGEGLCSSELLVLEPTKIITPEFLKFTILSDRFIENVNSSTYGSKMPRASWDYIGNIKMPAISIEEQKGITDFLDKEISRIDTLIEKKQQLIERLKEKRLAFISKAITRGLNAKAPLRTSGIDWANKIPQAWNTSKLKWYSKIYSGGTPDKTVDEYWTHGTIPWINSGSVNHKLIKKPTAYITQQGFSNSSAKWIPKYALVMALAGQGKTKGMVAQLDIETTCNQSMAAIITNDELLPRYLMYWLEINYQNIRNLAGGDYRDGLNLAMVGNIDCPIPPIEEQRQIIEILDRDSKNQFMLINKTQEAIVRLQEYKTALISAAVTGKIKVT